MSDTSEETERFEAVCEDCGLTKIVTWDGEKGICDGCRFKQSNADQ